MADPIKKKVPVRRKKASTPGKKVVTKEAPATFDNWKDQKSQAICHLHVHMFTCSEYSDSAVRKLETICEKECNKIVLLLRKRIRAKSKKIDLGCRII